MLIIKFRGIYQFKYKLLNYKVTKNRKKDFDLLILQITNSLDQSCKQTRLFM